MIVIKMELHSAVTSKITEIGRAYIFNDATGTAARGNYNAMICKKTNLSTSGQPLRRGRVENYPRKSYNVWRLAIRALVSCFPEEKTK